MKKILIHFICSFLVLTTSVLAQDLNIKRMEPGFHRMEVTHPDGTLQRYVISIPENYDSSTPTPMILGLHYGFNGMRGDNRPEPYWTEGFFNKIYKQAFEPLNAIFLAADSVSGNWQTPENEKALNALWAAVNKTYNIDERKTIVTGYSMGAFGTWHWASKYQDRFAGAFPIAGMPADMNTYRDGVKLLDTDWKIPLYIMHSHVDGLIDIEPTVEYVKMLKEQGKDVTFHELFVLTHHQENLLPEPVGHAVPWIKKIWAKIDAE
ncbi:hypothetical protein [Pseudemcibacter aquimaris]|uniref:carboxylesterase family protein n=1 Tax=Pseudemcibacter aquimaris TaxID=2857064 RepID=UPI002010EC7D|nr:hypothetical protein [Pseudemcibacter aquimaris]MCC3861570.1 hypothetical protein [Pseudemcibacter aquimaris]WDU58339.1 hypothetical protein KW060_14195 [Pseudemcibacter aquimaris]